jgi:hypothetical protein
LREGDKNTKIFHWVANSNRRKNTVDSIVVNGSISFDSSEIREHIVQFYTCLYSKQFSWRIKLDGFLLGLSVLSRLCGWKVLLRE